MPDIVRGEIIDDAPEIRGSIDGVRGESAYAVAVRNGFVGTEEEWLASLKGERGERGEQGIQGVKGDTGATGPKGDKGDTGSQGAKGDTGEGVPTGGTAGQVLKKSSGTDYDTEWADESGAVTEDEIADLKSAISGGTGLTENAKQALLACFEHVAWVDADGQEYYDALEEALYPPANLSSISAIFTQGQNVIYDTDPLDALKQYLVVTAHYSDSTTETISNYVLSGTLEEGTSVITVSYGGKTITFSVVVVHNDNVLTFTSGTLDENGVEIANTSRVRSDYVPIEPITYSLIDGDLGYHAVLGVTVNAKISGINVSTGAVTENSARLITQLIKVEPSSYLQITSEDGYYIKIFEYDSNGSLLNNVIGDLTTSIISGGINISAMYMRILFKKQDESDFTQSELESTTIIMNSMIVKANVVTNTNKQLLLVFGRYFNASKIYIRAIIPNGSSEDYEDVNTYSNSWLKANNSAVGFRGTGQNAEYIRILGKTEDSVDIESISGKITVNGKEYDIVFNGGGEG